MTHADTASGVPVPKRMRGCCSQHGSGEAAEVRPRLFRADRKTVVGTKDKWCFHGGRHDRSWRGNPSRRRRDTCYVIGSHYLHVESPAAWMEGENIVNFNPRPSRLDTDSEKTLQGISLKCPPTMTGHTFKGTKCWFLTNLKNFDKKLPFKSKVATILQCGLANASDDLLRSWRVPNKVGQCAGFPTSSFNCGKQPRYKHLPTTYWFPSFGAELPVLTHSWQRAFREKHDAIATFHKFQP